MPEATGPPAEGEALGVAALAQQLEALIGQLGEASRRTRNAAQSRLLAACPDALKHVSASLRGMADAVEAGRTDVAARQRRELVSLISGLGKSMSQLGEARERVETELAARTHELETASRQPPSQDLAGRLRDIAARMHRAVAELGQELQAAAEEAERAGQQAARFGAKAPSAPGASQRRGTALHDRPAFDGRLGFTIATGPFRGPWSLLLADVDRVEELTERHAVSAVDMLLGRIARMVGVRVQQECPDAFAAEYAESVFAVIVPGEAAAARRLADHLRTGIASVRWTVSGQKGKTELSTTASIGVAAYCAGDTVDALAERARRAVRQARQAGGDRVVADEGA